VAIGRENRTQLEYVVQTTLENAFVERARNGTKYTLQNGSVLFIQVSGTMTIDVDLTKMKPKGLAKWLVGDEA
jgi:CRISPR/Cas system CMR-associated protein Cmr3 (group 5 of RAMP superfamily)